MACKGEIVHIIGGANSAGQAAMHFSKFAEKVVMLVRGESLASTMSHYLIEQIEKTPNIEVQTRSSVAEVHGESRLTGLTILRSLTGEKEQMPPTTLSLFIVPQPPAARLRTSF